MVLAALLFVPGFRRQCRGLARSIPLTLWGRGQRVRASRILVSLTALAAFVALSSARHFLGDGYHRIWKNSNAETWHDMFRAPLTVTLLIGTHCTGRAKRSCGKPPKTLTAYTASFQAYFLRSTDRVPELPPLLGKTPWRRSIILAFLLTSGIPYNNSSGTWRIMPCTCRAYSSTSFWVIRVTGTPYAPLSFPRCCWACSFAYSIGLLIDLSDRPSTIPGIP